MTALSDTARELFSRPIAGWATVIDSEGRPHNSIVWVDVEGDGLIFNTAEGRAKDRFLRDNATVSLSVLDPDGGSWASVTGKATMTTEDGDEVIDRLAKKYLDADSYPYRVEGQQRITVRVTVDRLLEEAA